MEECIDRAPIHIQDEIIEEFCHSPQLHKVVQGNYGNYVIQKCLVVMSDKNVIKLIEKIIECLKDIYDYKIQLKWGQKILIEAIDKIIQRNPQMHGQADRLKKNL